MTYHSLKKSVLFIIAVLLFSSVLVFQSSCKKDEIDSDSSLKLAFSTDTLIFDTVFSTVGSVTQRLMVYNKTDSRLKISSIQLAGGSSSSYSINVDGSPGPAISDIELASGDSLFIFVRLTINPSNSNLPFIVEDSLHFLTNGNNQYIKLVAWGQDAWFHKPNYFPSNFPAYSVIKSDTTWSALKPHVIYGWLVIDSAAHLTIEAGTRIYFHNKGLMMVYKEGALYVNGTQEQPVLFRNDRLDPFYKDLTDQWQGLWFSEGFMPSYLNNVIIENGNLAIQADLPYNSNEIPLILNNITIRNMATGGIAGNGSAILGTNISIANTGGYTLSLNGGFYQFNYLSSSNSWSSSVRENPSLIVKNYYQGTESNIIVNNSIVSIKNSVIWGNLENELLIDQAPEGTFSYSFDHCFIKTNINTTVDPNFTSVTTDIDPKFTDVQKYNLRPDTLSPLIGAGLYIEPFIDLDGNSRRNPPAIGAFESTWPLR